MTRSIFDPTGGNTEHSGSAFTPADAGQISHLPAYFVDPQANLANGMVDFEPPVEEPAIMVSRENDGKLLLVRLTGKLHKKDYQRIAPIVEQAVKEHGKVRLLVRMYNFHGWDAGAMWEDVKFELKHFRHIERLAVVGDKTWEKWAVRFCKPFTNATIRYFPSEQADDARAWIAAG